MSRIEAVILDCDGVVVDSDKLHDETEQKTAITFAEEHHLDYDPDSADWKLMRGWARINIAERIYRVPSSSELADLFRLAVVEAILEVASTDNLSLIAGITPFVGFLRQQTLELGLATMSNRRIYTRYCELLPMDFFHTDYTVAQSEAIDDKPKPGPYREVMRRMGVPPEKTLIMEDSVSGIEGARYSGAIVLGLATTKSPEHLRTKTSAHLVATDFKDAARQIRPLFRR